MKNTFKIAVVQANHKGNDCNKNTEYGIEFVRKAKEEGADIVLFPECWINGYDFPILDENISIDEMFAMENYDKSIDEIKSNPIYQKWLDRALDEKSEFIGRFCSVSRELGIGIVITCYTKGAEGPRNSALVIDKNGKIIMTYSKVHTCDFSLESLLESGDEFKVCDFEGVKLGVMICYDREYPESARILMMKGAEIILVPNCCSGMEPRIKALCTRAYENMTGVVMANVPGKNFGRSCAYTPIAWDSDGNTKDMTIFEADDVSEKIYMAEYDFDELRLYRSREMMGNTFRKVKAYSELLNKEVKEPFVRSTWING